MKALKCGCIGCYTCKTCVVCEPTAFRSPRGQAEMSPELLEEQALWLRWLWRNYQSGPSPSGPNVKAWGATIADRLQKQPDATSKAKEAIFSMNDAVMEGSLEKALLAWREYELAIKEANGGTMYGSFSDKNSPGYRIQADCSAYPGRVPLWGQKGSFGLTIRGQSVNVTVGRGYGTLKAHFEFTGPVFRTGYLSVFDDFHARRTVDQAAMAILEASLFGKQAPKPTQDLPGQLTLF